MVAQLLEKDPSNRPFNARSVQAEMLKLFDEASPLGHSTRDVAASSVVDPGMSSLATKLNLEERPAISWTMISMLAIAAVALVVFAALASRK